MRMKRLGAVLAGLVAAAVMLPLSSPSALSFPSAPLSSAGRQVVADVSPNVSLARTGSRHVYRKRPASRPGHGVSHRPGHGSAHRPGGHRPGHGSSHRPGHKPGHGSGGKPGHWNGHRPGHGHGNGHWYHNNHYNGYRYGYRYPGYNYYYGGFWYATPWWLYGTYSYRPVVGGSAHKRWCIERYRRYNPATNLYVGNDGLRHRCISPY